MTKDGKRVISVSEEGTATIWDLMTGEMLNELRQQASLLAVAEIGNSRAIVTSKDLVVWDLDSGVALWSGKGHTGYVWRVAVSADGRLAASAASDSTLRVWDLQSGNTLAVFTSESALRCCAFITPTCLIAGDVGGRVHFLEVVIPKRSAVKLFLS